jgi:hypothetical protein
VRAFRWAVRLPKPPASIRYHLGVAVLGIDAWEAVCASYGGAAATPSSSAPLLPAWHSPLNCHPEHTQTEFGRPAPSPKEPTRLPLLRRPVSFATVGGALRAAFWGPRSFWLVAASLPRFFGLGGRRQDGRAYPARTVPMRLRPRAYWSQAMPDEGDLRRRRSAS